MILMWLDLAFMPVCAVLAGAILWLLYRDETLDDGALVRNFSFILVLMAGAGMGILRTDAVRMRIDPVFRIQTEVHADVLYSTIARIAPDEGEKLDRALQTEMAGGATLSDAYLTAHPWLWAEVRRRTGWADQATKLEWARYVTDTLETAHRARDNTLCMDVINNRPLDRETLLEKFSPESRERFRELAFKIYESSDRGMRREWNPNDKNVEFNEAAREFAVISDEIEERFGSEIVQQLRSDHIGSTPAESFSTVCTARIYQLEAMQKRPKAMASRLTDSILR